MGQVNVNTPSGSDSSDGSGYGFIVGILVAFVVPSFTRVTEQSHVDAAAQYLRSIWSARTKPM